MKNRSGEPHAPGARREWLFALALLQPAIVVVIAASYSWASPLTLLHDPFKISQSVSPLHPLMGALSSLGAILFFCTSAIALFGATLATERTSRLFLIYAGLYSSFLACDDFFGLHDSVFIEVSIRELYVKLVLVAGLIAYLGAFHKLIRKLNYIVLAGALLLFGMSLTFDSRVMHFIEDVVFGARLTPAAEEAWEDLPKLAGTVLWLWFHMLAARTILSRSNSLGSVRQVSGK